MDTTKSIPIGNTKSVLTASPIELAINPRNQNFNFENNIDLETIYELVYEPASTAIGCNLRPSAIFLERIIDLHREVKKDIYVLIRKKIAEQFICYADTDRVNSGATRQCT